MKTKITLFILLFLSGFLTISSAQDNSIISENKRIENTKNDTDAGNETTIESEIKISPTAAKNFILIEVSNLQQNSQLAIIDTGGRAILRSHYVTEANEIPISNINDGVYFVNLMKGEKLLATQKLVIRK